MKFIAYVHSKRAKVEFEVESKVRTNVRGHYTYALCGHTDDGVRAAVAAVCRALGAEVRNA